MVLSNREPLRLASIERPLNIPGRGSLAIRAAAGVNPVLTVELKGRSPFLATGPGVELVLDGVTLVAHCSDPGPGGVPPPLIQAAGAVNLKRCALRVGDRSKVKGFRGVVTDGGALTVEDCWFEGFDTAVEVHSFAGTSATLRQTMVVPSAAPGTAPPTSASADRHGWGLEVRFAPGGQSAQTRKVVLDHCTFSGAGLLDLAGFSPKAPLQVEARGCAVQTEALVAWRPAQPEIPLNAQTLQWSGEGNQYDVNPQTWIVLSTRMTPALSTGVTDVAGWSRLVLEKEPIEGGVRFLTSPEARSESLQPQDFAVAPAGARKAGADPARIGPWARGPASPSG